MKILLNSIVIIIIYSHTLHFPPVLPLPPSLPPSPFHHFSKEETIIRLWNRHGSSFHNPTSTYIMPPTDFCDTLYMYMISPCDDNLLLILIYISTYILYIMLGGVLFVLEEVVRGCFNENSHFSFKTLTLVEIWSISPAQKNLFPHPLFWPRISIWYLYLYPGFSFSGTGGYGL